MNRTSVLVAALLVACSASGQDPGASSPTPDTGGKADSSSGFDVGSDGATLLDSTTSADTGSDDSGLLLDAGTSFGSSCDAGRTPTITGTVFAPNGTDPVPNAEVYAPVVVNPFTPGVACDTCDKSIDTYWVTTQSAADGTFTLDLSAVPVSSSVKLAVRKGRFRKVTTLAVSCGASVAAPTAQTTLPGSATTGEDSIPKIAVGTGNSDHLDTILSALGVTAFDCYEGRKTTTSSNCPAAESTGKRISALLTSATSLNAYNLLFLSCAPGIWTSYSSSDQTTIAANLAAWVNAGGRLIVTDNSYDYVSQSWPSDLSWQGPGGTPWPAAGANVGDVPSGGSSTATVDDADLVAWLKIVGVTSAPNVSIGGWLHSWSVMQPLPASSQEIAHGSVQYTYPASAPATTVDLPLTSEFIKNKCGRVIYSSYHTLSSVSASSLSAQEKILEYLILDVAACLRDGIK